MTLSKSGRVPWTRRELDEWLTHLNTTFLESKEGEWNSTEETLFYLHKRYGGKSLLWIGRTKAVEDFMRSFASKLIKDGFVTEEKGGYSLSEYLLDALTRLPITSQRTGFSYLAVTRYIRNAQKAN
jgi:hypothetical protein